MDWHKAHFDGGWLLAREPDSLRCMRASVHAKKTDVTFSIHPKDGYSVTPMGAYLLNENFETQEAAQAAIDHIGLEDVLEVRSGGVEEGVIPITKGLKR